MHASAQEWLAELADAWRAERAAAAARFEEERAGRSLAERVADGTALSGLQLAEERGASRGRARVRMEAPSAIDLDDLRLGPGDPIALWDRGDGEGVRLRGVLERREGQGVWLVLDDFPEPDRRWALDAEAPELTFERGARALARLGAAAASAPLGRLRAVLARERPPTLAPPAAWTPRDRQLDEQQRAAVDAALRALDVALIHGPPGTGKTRTLLEVVRQRVARGERLLCAAPSNAAVDHLAGLLAELGELRVVRLGHPARIAPALAALSLDAQVDADGATARARQWRDRAAALRKRARGRGGRELWAEARQLERDAAAELSNVERAIVERAHVVLTTCTGADHPVLGDRVFDAVILDEATQAPDPIAAIAAGRGRQLILAGDPQQLGPVVIDRDAEPVLGRTMFERIAAHAAHADGGAGAVMLERQHRMHARIMEFSSVARYGGRLRAAAEVAAHVLEDLGVRPDAERPGPFVLIDTAGKGWSEERAAGGGGSRGGRDPSLQNPGHAERVAAEARRLLSRGLPPGELAVIAAYDAQVRRLRALLSAERHAGVAVGTVDSFQGQEREAVIVDLVRSNERRELGFLADLRRSNVALTRARRFLLVVADSSTLGEHAYYGELQRYVEALGGHVSAWADEAPPLDDDAR
ncbi:MAG: AAA domain-containing protein [Kofleriaceae bacterium]